MDHTWKRQRDLFPEVFLFLFLHPSFWDFSSFVTFQDRDFESASLETFAVLEPHESANETIVEFYQLNDDVDIAIRFFTYRFWRFFWSGPFSRFFLGSRSYFRFCGRWFLNQNKGIKVSIIFKLIKCTQAGKTIFSPL